MKEEEVLGFKRRWELTAPESYALLHGPKHEYGTQAFKLALVELIAREKITLVEEEKLGLLGRRSVAFLASGKDLRRPNSRPLAAMLDLLDAARARMSPAGTTVGVPVTKLVRAARKKYGWPGGYTEAEVMPALAARGLYERREKAIPVPFGSSRWEPTASGRRMMEELETGMSLGYGRFGEWVDENPRRALQFLGFAGSAALIMGPLHQDLRRLSKRREVASSHLAHAPVETDWLGPDDPLVFDSSLAPNLEIFGSLDGVFYAIDFGLAGGEGGGST
jgi:hypothetical protein